ncbi:MAG TPA: GNAT family N-acetyltransferase [Gaiellaceae bacterium]|nr:GNAT family N-acetyltransferase [Gaiellaceae bacterium]
MTAAAALRDLYDAQLRAHVPEPLPAGLVVERDGPLVRSYGLGPQGWVEYRDLGDLSAAELDELIARQVARFSELGVPFEWKFHSHDRPAVLEERLVAAGFVAEDLETVLVAEAAAVPAGEPPQGVRLREVRERADLERIDDLAAVVWGEGERWHAEVLSGELAADPDGIAVVVAEAEGAVVSAAWVRFPAGTEFATFWGGSTHPDWRGRGIYRALVAHRARLALARGRRWLEVDALPTSRPILERLGFRAVTETRPYVWTPR